MRISIRISKDTPRLLSALKRTNNFESNVTPAGHIDILRYQDKYDCYGNLMELLIDVAL